MMARRAALAGLAAAALVILAAIFSAPSALAYGRGGAPGPSIYAASFRADVARHRGRQTHWAFVSPTHAGPPSLYAPSLSAGAAGMTWRLGSRAASAAWNSGSALAAEAARYVGSGKFTRLPGAWCADAVNVWLTATGHRPLSGRSAGAALAYGPHVADPRPGDLVVMATRRGYAGHVGIVEGVEPDGSIDIVSGNWSHRVARAVISRRSVTAFVRV